MGIAGGIYSGKKNPFGGDWVVMKSTDFEHLLSKKLICTKYKFEIAVKTSQIFACFKERGTRKIKILEYGAIGNVKNEKLGYV